MKKFMVEYTFRGRATDMITAASQEEAELQVENQLDDEEFDVAEMAEYTNIDDYTVREMFRVKRGEQVIWTTYVFPTDIRIEE